MSPKQAIKFSILIFEKCIEIIEQNFLPFDLISNIKTIKSQAIRHLKEEKKIPMDLYFKHNCPLCELYFTQTLDCPFCLWLAPKTWDLTDRRTKCESQGSPYAKLVFNPRNIVAITNVIDLLKEIDEKTEVDRKEARRVILNECLEIQTQRR